MRSFMMLFVLAFVPAERHLQDPVKNDMDRLQGAWVLTDVQREQPMTPDKMLNNQVLIAGDEYKRFTLEEPPILVRTFKLMPHTTPKSVDLIAKNPGGADFVFKGIYEIEGDTFRFCFALYGNERPTEFRIGNKSTANTITTYRLINRTR